VLTAIVRAVSYAAGQVIAQVVGRRLAAFARRTGGKWDDVAIGELSRRVPLWSLLVGAYIAAGFWTLPIRVALTLNQALFIVLVLSLTWMVASMVARLTAAYGSTFEQALPVTSLTQNVARILIVILGVLIILNGLGLSITPVLTALGVGGLAVALALQDTLSNLFAGFYVILARQIRVGDFVQLESGETGYIEDIGWRATLVRQLSNNIVLVPNAKLAQSVITNYYLPGKDMAVLVEVGVDYASDLRHVERVTCDVGRDVMRDTTGAVGAFEPFIRYHTFGESSVNFTVILRGQEFTDQYLIKHEFVKRLHERYQREGITIPFPTRTIHSFDAPAG
jgi:small-conductance mechanosensitive channel